MGLNKNCLLKCQVIDIIMERNKVKIREYIRSQKINFNLTLKYMADKCGNFQKEGTKFVDSIFKECTRWEG